MRRLGVYAIDDVTGEYFVSIDKAIESVEGQDEGHGRCIIGWLLDCRAIASELDPGPPPPVPIVGVDTITTDHT